jgi:hypothetical protein
VSQFLQTFYYAKIPHPQGRQHIHTLELLEGMPGRGGEPFFRILNASAPMRLGRFTTVSCWCSLLGRPQHIQMLSDGNDTNHVVCLSNASTVASFRLRVMRAPHGHVVCLRSEYHRAPRRVDRVMQRVVRFMRFLESHIRWRERAFETRNLTMFRRMALGTNRP